MKRRLTLAFTGIICSIGILRSQVPFECKGQFYISFTTPTTSSLVEAVIDPVTDQVEFLMINDNLKTFINGAGYRISDNFIYAVEPLNHNLYRIDANGTAQDLGILDLNRNHVYLAGDISPDGRYLVLIGTVGSSTENRDAEIRLVDLSQQGFPVLKRTISGQSVNMLDIAFDPTDGTLYGVDARENRLVVIDFITGRVTAPYPSTEVMDDAGSLFFDSFGDLYAYGGPPGNNGIQNTLYKVDKKTGVFEILTSGTRAIATDGCSCPHTVELRKEVFPRVVVPCAEVRYVFTIANSSSTSQRGVDFRDTLPAGFRISEIAYNPYGGLVRSGPGNEVLFVEDMNLLPGIDSIVMYATTSDIAEGIYKNQAMLTGLPQALGYIVRSDDPTTIVKYDSTALSIKNFESPVILSKDLCTGESVTLDVSPYGTSFAWDNGITGPTLIVTQGGMYTCVAATACDTILVEYEVIESGIHAYFNPDAFDIRYGDTVHLDPVINNTGDTAIFRWLVPEGDVLPCNHCPELYVTPYRDTEYNLLVENEDGCTTSARVLVRVDRTRRYFAPNVFTPNGDDTNDEFFLRVRGIASITRFSIFDRWGNMVFTGFTPMTSHPEIRWNGLHGQNELQPGVFAWIAEVKFGDGLEEVYSGDVTLLK